MCHEVEVLVKQSNCVLVMGMDSVSFRWSRNSLEVRDKGSAAQTGVLPNTDEG